MIWAGSVETIQRAPPLQLISKHLAMRRNQTEHTGGNHESASISMEHARSRRVLDQACPRRSESKAGRAGRIHDSRQPCHRAAVTGKPHAGKVLAAIQPHSDDIPIFAAGTVAKLLNEGYTGYLIRVTNDDMAGPGSIGNTVLANEVDNNAVARVLGLQKVFDLNYGNHMIDAISRSELRSRLIFLFRLLSVDTIVCYDPWAHYDENPDHYITAHCVEAACWMAGGEKDFRNTLPQA